MKQVFFSLVIIAALIGIAAAQAPFELDKVKSIKIMESTRDDVRRVFAGFLSEEVEADDHYDKFFVNDAEIEFNYSEGECSDYSDSLDFSAAEWKVVNIVITPRETTDLKKLEINLKELKKERLYADKPHSYAYYNKQSGLTIRVDREKILDIRFLPPKKYYGLMCDKEVAKKLMKSDSIFENKLSERFSVIRETFFAYVQAINLSRNTIIANCSDLKNGNVCFKNTKTINISTKAVDPEKDPLTYTYIITAGKIIGTGAKVVWDLTGVKAGTYTITAAVDDGCGFCGVTMTKTITVKECDRCR